MTPTQPLSKAEFVVLVATLISLVALSIDVVLPALSQMGRALGAASENDAQLVIGTFFVGLGVGQLLTGPLSDSVGRKPVIYGGLALFAVGGVLSLIAEDFDHMLLGRLLQGLGCAGPRIVTVAMVRDLYAGRGMAQIMSFAMTVFIIVPVVAPAIGQVILEFADWRTIFVSLLVMACVSFLWLATRQPETLERERRRPFSARALRDAVIEVLRNRIALGYTLAAGVIFGAFFSYLSTAQQIFQGIFALGDLFPYFFAVLALAVGAASLSNAKLVMRFGMRWLSTRALIAMTAWSLICLAALLAGAVPATLAVFLGWGLPAFFCVGMLFSNFNALAMEPLGHIAGVGAAIVGSLTTLTASLIGVFAGRLFDGTVVPLITAFGLCGALATAIVMLTERGRPDGGG